MLARNKLRVTVEVCEKVITFDWNLPVRTADPTVMNLGGVGGVMGMCGSTSGTEDVSLYFFTRLSNPGVAVTVDADAQ